MTGKDDPREAEVHHEHGEAALAEDLRRITLQVDPVPPEAVRVAKEGYVWRTIDSELAELVYDSLVDHEDRVSARGVTEPRLLTFRGAGYSIEVEVAGTGARCDVLGQFVPPGPTRVRLQHADGSADLTVDDLGRFGLRGVSAGLVRLAFQAPDGASEVPVVTQWVPI